MENINISLASLFDYLFISDHFFAGIAAARESLRGKLS